MNGIDVSSYQSDLDVGAIAADFVIIKATQGTTYVNPHCDTHVQQAKAAGKKLGVYHFADGGDAIAEANYFVDNCAGYIRQAIFILDWEGEGTEFVGWAKLFLEHVESRIGYKPSIYMSESVENAYDWSSVVAGNFGLWIAKYLDNSADSNYDMSNAGPEPVTKYWPFYYIWQWTSTGRLNGYGGNLDLNRAYITPQQWDAYAGVTDQTTAPAPQPAPAPLPEPTPLPPPEPAPAPAAPPTNTTTEPTPVPVTVKPAPTPPDEPKPVNQVASGWHAEPDKIINSMEGILKDGYKTTEFWVAVYSAIGPLLWQGFGIHLPGLAIIGQIVAAATYIWARAIVKRANVAK